MQTFRDALRTKDFTLTAELALDAGLGREAIITQAQALAEHVDAIQIADSSESKIHLSTLAAAALLLDVGVDPVLYLSCRDRNRLALCGDILGAAALGVSSLVLRRGADIPVGVTPPVKKVNDWRAKQLIAFAKAVESADFTIGSFATVFKPDSDWKPERLSTQADAGARFIQTQLCFNAKLLRHYMKRLVGEKLTHRVSVLVGLAPLPSADVAEWLRKNRNGTVIPVELIKRLQQAADPELEGINICAELLREIAGIAGVSGANLVCFGNSEAVAEAVRQSGIRG